MKQLIIFSTNTQPPRLRVAFVEFIKGRKSTQLEVDHPTDPWVLVDWAINWTQNGVILDSARVVQSGGVR